MLKLQISLKRWQSYDLTRNVQNPTFYGRHYYSGILIKIWFHGRIPAKSQGFTLKLKMTILTLIGNN